MRKACLNAIFELAKKDRRVFFIGSDLGVGTLDVFKQEMPDRFFMEGVSEANIIGMATGLALEGKIPYVNTISTFLTRRCFEQIAIDVCLHKASVRLIGSGGGLVYAPLGPTHLAIEDIAILRALPNMTIVAPADSNEMRRLMPSTLDYAGPIYIRLAKGNDPLVTTDEGLFKIGKVFPMRQGSHAVIVTTGITLQIALGAAASLSQNGIEVGILHAPTIKPLDHEAILDYVSKVPAVVAVEEHTIIGGLGSAVAEIIAEANFAKAKRFRRVGIPDVFSDEYGSQSSQMESFSITQEALAGVITDLLGQRQCDSRHTVAN